PHRLEALVVTANPSIQVFELNFESEPIPHLTSAPVDLLARPRADDQHCSPPEHRPIPSIRMHRPFHHSSTPPARTECYRYPLAPRNPASFGRRRRALSFRFSRADRT